MGFIFQTNRAWLLLYSCSFALSYQENAVID